MEEKAKKPVCSMMFGIEQRRQPEAPATKLGT
jgi:hypothetical protein